MICFFWQCFQQPAGGQAQRTGQIGQVQHLRKQVIAAAALHIVADRFHQLLLAELHPLKGLKPGMDRFGLVPIFGGKLRAGCKEPSDLLQ